MSRVVAVGLARRRGMNSPSLLLLSVLKLLRLLVTALSLSWRLSDVVVDCCPARKAKMRRHVPIVVYMSDLSGIIISEDLVLLFVLLLEIMTIVFDIAKNGTFRV